MKIERFEDINIWKQSRILVNSIYHITSGSQFSNDFGLKDQIQRASVSIMTNIAEGFERDNNKEFKRFLFYSKGSAGEVRSLLYLAMDLKYITEDEFKIQYDNVISIIRQIYKFIKYLKDNLSDR